jgi:hypothetical protein
MKTKQILLPAALVAALAAVPAQAHDKPEGTGKPTHPAQAQGPKSTSHTTTTQSTSHPKKSKPTPTRAYVAHGIIQAAALTKNADGTYDGTLTVDVKQTNQHGRWSKKTTQTFTLDNAKVHFGGGETDAKQGDRVTIVGRIAKTKKAKASTDGTTPATPPVTVKSVSIKPPKTAPKTPTPPPTTTTQS